MNKCVFLSMIFCMALALSALAQDNNTSSSTSSSSQSASATQSEREPLTAPKAANFWDGDTPNLANLVAHPFANKKYVLRYTVPIRDRVNELDEITAENANRIKDVDARSQKGLQLASEKASLADQHANDADNKAQSAHTSATQASTNVTAAEQVVANIDQYKGTAQTEIQFRPGQSVLSKSAKDALDQMAEPLKSQRSYIIEVRGFSAGHGQSAISSSQKMSDSVVRYLVLNHQIPLFRIYVTNLGSASVAGEGTSAKPARGGRVEVNVLKNDLSASNR
jgi:outer membrane protein OmpA-like peptidoglycan-associated protein